MGGYANGGDAENSTSTDPQTRLGGDGGPYDLTTTEITTIVVTITVFLLALFLIFYYRKLQARRKLDMMSKTAALENGLHTRKNSAAPGSSGSGRVRGGESIELKLKDNSSSTTSTLTSSTTTTVGAPPAPGPRPSTPAPPAKDRPKGGEVDGGTTPGGKQSVPRASQDGNGPFTTPSCSTHRITAAAASAPPRMSLPPPALIATRTTTLGEKPPLWKYIHWKGDPKRNSKSAALLPSFETRRRGSNGVLQDKDDAPIPPNPYYG